MGLIILRLMRSFRLLGVLVCFTSLYVIHMMGSQLTTREICASGLHCGTRSTDKNNLRNTGNSDVTISVIPHQRIPYNRHRNFMSPESNVRRSITRGQSGTDEKGVKYRRLISYLRKLADALTSHNKLLIRNATFVNQVLSLIKETIHHIEKKEKQNIQPRTTFPSYTTDGRISLLSHGLCPEVYMGSRHGYPFYETGFLPSHCNNEPKPIGVYISAVFNFISQSRISSTEVQALIHSFTALYPSVPVYVAIPEGVSLGDAATKCTYVDITNPGEYPGSAWNRLVALVKTGFVFVSAGASRFDGDSNMERLLRSILTLDIPIVGGAIKTPIGSWDMGCVQTVFRNYSLLYSSGYWHSQKECVYCTHISSPFLAQTRYLLDHKLPMNITEGVLFTEYFLILSQSGLYFAVCPDVMFHITGSYLSNQNRGTWLPMARRWKINSIRFPNKAKVIYACDELYIDCAFHAGIAVPPCCLRLLSEQIKYIIRICKKYHIICELQEGTLLGSTKFGKVLPWERDGDITVLSSNFSALVNLSRVFTSAGYEMKITGQTRCCVEDRVAGGALTIGGHGSPWPVEVYGQHRMDSEIQIENNSKPTKLLFDGMWVQVPRNPGKHVRNRYGHEVYRHAEHWISLGKYSGWEEYDTSQGFPKCPKPGMHYCLDKYPADGNLPFQEL